MTPSHSRRLQSFAALLALLAAFVLLAAACGSDDGAPPEQPGSNQANTAEAHARPDGPDNRFAGVPGIVDPSNLGWPREVEGLNGRVTIHTKPERIHTMSAGFDEITIALVPLSRIVAVGKATQDPESSSMADLAKQLPAAAREPEAIAQFEPDIVVAPPTQKAEVVDAIARLGIPIVQIELDPTPEGRLNTILLLGYIYGEEERAIGLTDEVRARYEAVTGVTSAIPEEERPLVLATTKYNTITVAGSGTTGGGIIEAAGGINAAAELGIEGNAQSSIEGIVAANPDVILLPMPREPAEAFRDEILGNPALASVPAVAEGRVYLVPPELYTTNSFANVRAVEHLAHILWPDRFPEGETAQFSLPAGSGS